MAKVLRVVFFFFARTHFLLGVPALLTGGKASPSPASQCEFMEDTAASAGTQPSRDGPPEPVNPSPTSCYRRTPLL